MPLVLIGCQIFLLFLIWKLSVVGSRHLVYRLTNPFCWFIGFYALWFLLPQIAGASVDYYILGLNQYPKFDLITIYVESQLWLCLFLVSIIVPLLFMYFIFLRNSGERSYRAMLTVRYETSHEIFLWAFFTVGIIASLYVATLNVGNVGGFRSDIVKSVPGKIATALSYIGAFSYAYLAIHFYTRRRWVFLLLLTCMFVAGVFLTGARGRLLWPIVIALMFKLAQQNKVNVIRLSVIGTALLLVLLTLDPIVKIVKEGGQSYVFTLEQFLSPIIYKRNFDGFANFSLIVTHNIIDRDLSYLFFGGRDPFMGAHYQWIYEKGVGFGSTIPGLFWMSGGPGALVICGIIYSYILCVINLWLRSNSSNMLYWAFLFIMPWFCALGGNLVESLDKMLVAGFAPLFLHVILQRSGYIRAH